MQEDRTTGRAPAGSSVAGPARVLVVQHLEPEQPAAVLDSLVAAGATVDTVRTDLGDEVPSSAEGLRGLVVLGGPMSARRDDGFPSRSAEMALLREALRSELPVLGVCLGAQLLAAAAGAAVRGGDGPEVGWAPVSLTSAARDDALFAGCAPSVTVLHWHGETFDLPAGAVHLASSSRYPNQAFRIGPAAWGLQFHLEVDAAAVERFIAAFPGDAEAAPGGAEAIRAATPSALEQLEEPRNRILGRFAEIVAGP